MYTNIPEAYPSQTHIKSVCVQTHFHQDLWRQILHLRLTCSPFVPQIIRPGTHTVVQSIKGNQKAVGESECTVNSYDAICSNSYIEITHFVMPNWKRRATYSWYHPAPALNAHILRVIKWVRRYDDFPNPGNSPTHLSISVSDSTTILPQISRINTLTHSHSCSIIHRCAEGATRVFVQCTRGGGGYRAGAS